MSHFLRYELTPIPTSLFKENFMRKSAKSKLAKTLDDKCNRKLLRQKDLVNADGYADHENDMEEEDEKEEEDSDEVLNEENYPVEDEFEDDPDILMSTDGSVQRYVIDGGYLLHRNIWEQHCLYSEIISKYQEYVKRYGICTVVFDGYRNDPSAKNHEQERSRKGSTITPDVSVEMQNSIGSIKKRFVPG